MAVAVQPGYTWEELVDHTAGWLTAGGFGVFDQPRVIVPSSGAGRLLSQALASRLPGGITAGVEILTLPAWIRALARQADVEAAFDQWQPASLELMVWQELSRLAASGGYPELSHHLRPHSGTQERPHRGLIMAGRVTRLMLRYIHHAPELVQRWISGDPTDVDGAELPTHQRWQPRLMAHLAEATGTHPVALFTKVAEAAGRDTTPTVAVGLRWLTPTEESLLAAARAGGSLTRLEWELPTGASHARVELHGSHDLHRQAQVLRDVLARYFQEDPTLEPRHVALVSPQPEQWRATLHSRFAPLAVDDHPARSLRVAATPSVTGTNPVLDALHQILGLGETRATSNDLLRLLTNPAIASRWRFEHTRLVELLAAVELRWGLDAQHRESQGLTGLTQNTWTRAVDRLLVSVALGSTPALEQIVGVDAVSSTDARLIGALSEVVSRLRRFVAISSEPATPAVWAERLLALIIELFDDRGEHGWESAEAQRQLSDFRHGTRDVTTHLSRGEFARILKELLTTGRFRPSVGNGTIPLLSPAEVLPASHRVVIFLGIQDSGGLGVPDEIAVGAPDEHTVMLQQLAAQAHPAQRVAFFYASRNQANAPLARPTTIDHLLAQLGAVPQEFHHPPSARDSSAFTPETSHRSFDVTAARLAARAAEPGSGTEGPAAARRHIAMNPPSPSRPAMGGALQVQEVTRFLKNPAAEFLRHRVGLRLFRTPTLETSLPLDPNGLEKWRVRENLLEALKSGSSLEQAQERERFREALPPGRVGWSALGALTRDVEELWGQARGAWEAPVTTHRLHLPELRGSISTRGGHVVEVGTSGGPGLLVKAWLELLAVAAQGITTTAVVFQLRKEGFTHVVQRTRLTAPSAPESLLQRYLDAVRIGRTRLLPLPQDPAFSLLRALADPAPDFTAWVSPPAPWHSPWPRNQRGREWSLFFDGPADELLHLPGHPEDAHLGSATHGAFGAWAHHLYTPLLRAREGM